MVLLRNFSILLVLILAATASGATYYVDDANGSNTNVGSATLPWKTLARAYPTYTGEGTKVQEGDTVYFRNGDYGEFRETGLSGNRANWITYAAASGHSPNLSNIYVSDGDYDAYLKWSGFNIKDGIILYHSSYLYIYDCNITSIPQPYEGFYAPYFAAGDGTAIYARYNVNHVTIEDCTISYTYRPIRFGLDGAEYWTIKNNTIHRFAEDGIRPEGASHVLIEDNYIYDTEPARSSFGLEGTGSGNFEVGETVIQAGTNAEGVVYQLSSANKLGIYTTSETLFATAANGGGTVTGQSSEATMSSISKCDYSHSDAIQIQTSTAMTDLVFRGNTFNPGQSTCVLLALYGNGTDVTFENNLAWGHSSCDLQIGGIASGLKICNNTFMSGVRLTHGYSGDGSGLPSVTDAFYNNITESLSISEDTGELYIQVLSHGNNIFQVDPDGEGGPAYPFDMNMTECIIIPNLDVLFVDVNIYDFNLVAGSQAIDFGTASYGPETDILGNARVGDVDAGAYEYQTPVTPITPTTQYKLNDNLADTVVVDEFDSNGVLVSDDSDNTNHNSIIGKINRALRFSGGTVPALYPQYATAQNDYVDTGKTYESIMQDSFSVSLWARPYYGLPEREQHFVGARDLTDEHHPENAFVVTRHSGNGGDETAGVLSARFRAGGFGSTYDAYAVSAEAVFTPGAQTWKHIVVVVNNDANQMSLYLNGSLVTLSTNPIKDGIFGDDLVMSNYSQPSDLFIGGSDVEGTLDGNEVFQGDLDNVVIFNKVLLQADIDFLYNSGNGTEELPPNNHAPVLAAIGNQTIKENRLLTITAHATDDDDDALTYSWSNWSGAVADANVFTWRPGYRDAGDRLLTCSVSDGQTWDSNTITITVTNAPQGLIVGD
jgi:hypothetical protein